MKSYNAATCSIRDWAGKQGWWAGTRDETHLLMDGGRLHVPMSNNQSFLTILGENLESGVNNYVIECRTPVFVMHADLDILEPNDNPMTAERFEVWAREIQLVVKDFFFNATPNYKYGIRDPLTGRSFNRLSMLVCMAPLKKDVEKNKEMWTKTGIHLIWPWIYVTADQAEKIRSGWIQHFQRTFGNRGKHNIWEDVFDISVYRGNGLRMIGSDKIEQCPSCKGKKARGGFCPMSVCNGLDGKYAANRVYRVTDAYCGEGVRASKLLAEACVSPSREIMITSIRTPVVTPTPMQYPDWYDQLFFHDEEETHRRIWNPTPTERKIRREALGQMPENIQAAKELGITDAPKIPRTDRRMEILQKWIKSDDQPIHSRIPDVYRRVEIVDLVRMQPAEAGSEPYYLARTDSFFCQNKGGEHNQNNIYFLIRSTGWYQKCFCRCASTEGRANGVCKDYCSGVKTLPPFVRQEFYPEQHKMLMEAHQICQVNEHIHDTVQLSMDHRIALQRAKDESLKIRLARCNARKQAEYEDRFKSKRD